MCGIAGLVDAAADAKASLDAMLARIAHRGPDDVGAWLDPDSGIALGHRRLAILDTSPCGHQPMASASGRYVLTYNGEIYNYVELRSALEATGATWHGHSDTEVLLAGFDAWGIAGTLRRCNGMFALAAWDREARTLTLARDRMGEKPLYFGWVGGRFAFASELKALAALPGWMPRMHPEAVASFLGAGYVRGPQSAIDGVYRLPPAASLALSLADLGARRDWPWLEARIAPYWSLGNAALGGLAPSAGGQTATRELEELLADAVRLRMLADVPLGAFLSGGIDSSLVVALMQAQSARPVRTFSIGFHEAAHDEAPHARAVARHLGTEHTELYVGAHDALALVPRLAETFDEPFADHSQLPTMLVSQLARRHVTVALSGDGGDELFAGYGRYFAILRLWNGLRRLPPAARRVAAPLLAGAAAASRPFARILPRMHGPAFRLARLGERLAAGDADALRLSFIAGGGVARMLAGPPSRDILRCLPPDGLDDTLRRLMYADQLDYLPDDILHKVDRAAMAYALETRVPLLDHRVVEYSWRLPTASLVAHGQGKQPLRAILDRHVPRALVERPKQGFAPPIGHWLRGPLCDWAESLLSTASLRELPLLDAGGVRAAWADHLRGRIDAGGALWNVLMLADWRQRFGASA
ncbi:MAG TPA: asparagine synthase (glutamine-hydrolyzing) [Xanthomonadaceae bacterium]|nr:asparagine synthase (glutamine-hydrolyzing) [Xanthomonadaceae bacterium]